MSSIDKSIDDINASEQGKTRFADVSSTVDSSDAENEQVVKK